MGRILIGEPHSEIRELLAHVVRGLGFESVLLSHLSEYPDVDRTDVLILEPGDRQSATAARRLRARQPDLPIVCVSIYPPDRDEISELNPVAYFVKPFSVTALQSALVEAAALTFNETAPSGNGSL